MATTAERLTSAARDILDKFPHLGPSEAWRRALEANPALAHAHFAGDAGGPPEAPQAPPAAETAMVDPGAVLMQVMAARRCTLSEAMVLAPTAAAFYGQGRYMPAQGAAGRHYSALSEAEKRHWLPMGSVRRLRPGERPGPRETMFATFAPGDPGALFAEVTS